jgi:ATP-binding protein involved in chromosome partitioning
VENMSGLYCPHCDGFIPIFGTGGGEKTAEKMKIPFLGPLPFDPAVVVGGDRGRPVLEEEGETPFKKAVHQFSALILDRLGESELQAEPAKEHTVH